MESSICDCGDLDKFFDYRQCPACLRVNCEQHTECSLCGGPIDLTHTDRGIKINTDDYTPKDNLMSALKSKSGSYPSNIDLINIYDKVRTVLPPEFEKPYKEKEESETSKVELNEVTAATFEDVLPLIKEGRLCKRFNWKNVRYIKLIEVQDIKLIMAYTSNESTDISFPWNPSLADLLANDWFILD